MPIVINYPDPGERFGPGSFFSLVIQTPGEVPVGTRFELDVLTTDTSEQPTWHWEFITTIANTLSVSRVFLTTSEPLQFSNLSRAQQIANGEQISLRARYTLPGGGQEQTSQIVTWDPTLMAWNNARANAEIIEARTNARLNIIEGSTIKQMGIPGAQISVPIAELLQKPPIGFQTRERILPDRSGEGSLTRPAGPISVNAFGLMWDFVFVPPGIGGDQGAPDTYEHDMVKLSTTHTLRDGDEFVSRWETFRTSDTPFYFGELLPTRVNYWILPFVVVRFYWILLQP